MGGDVLQVRRPGGLSVRGHSEDCPPQQEELTHWQDNLSPSQSRGGPGGAGRGEESYECAGSDGAADHDAQEGKPGGPPVKQDRTLGQVEMEMFDSVMIYSCKETINIVIRQAESFISPGSLANVVFISCTNSDIFHTPLQKENPIRLLPITSRYFIIWRFRDKSCCLATDIL